MGLRRPLAHAVVVALLIGLTQLAGTPANAAALAWVPTGSMMAARSAPASALLADGRVMIAGGLTPGTTTALRSVEIYNPGSGTWSPTGSMQSPRAWFTLTRLNDGRVLAVGGFTGTAYTGTTEFWSPASGSWSGGPSLPAYTCDGPCPAGNRAHHAAVLLTSGPPGISCTVGCVLVAGGGDSPNLTEHPDGSRSLFMSGGEEPASVLYSPATNSWTHADASGGACYPAVATPCTYQSAERQTLTRLSNGQVLAVGGYQIYQNTSYPVTYISRDLSQIYDPGTNLWTDTHAADGSLASLRTARDGHVAALLPNGTVLVAGGESDPFGGPDIPAVALAEIFTPAAATGIGAWAAAPSMKSSRAFASAVTLPGGSILVTSGLGGAGGNCSSGCTALASAEIFTPSSSTWASTAPMNHGRTDHAAATLRDGRVLAAATGAAPTSAELFEVPPPPSTAGPTPTPGCVPAPRLVADPPLAPPGDATMVTGAGFCPGPVALAWVRGIGTAASEADAGGNFHVQLLVLPHDALGPRAIVATQGAASVSIPFLVVPAPLEPPDFRSRR